MINVYWMDCVRRKASLVLTFLAISATPVRAVAQTTEKSSLQRLLLSIHRLSLDNGIRVVMQVDPSSPLVAVGMTYGADRATHARQPKRAAARLAHSRGGTSRLWVTASQDNQVTLFPAAELSYALWLSALQFRDATVNSEGEATAVLSVVGDFDADTAAQLIHKHFEGLPTPTSLPRSEAPRQENSLAPGGLSASGTPAHALVYGWSIPTEHTEAAMVLANSLAEGMSASLYQTLVVKTKLARAVDSGLARDVLESLLWLRIEMRPAADRRRADAIVERELARLAGSGPTPSELARGKAQARQQLLESLLTLSDRAVTLGRREASHGDARSIAQAERNVRDADQSAIRELARQFLVGKKRSLSMPEPAEESP